jgi:hypothetical protein
MRWPLALVALAGCDLFRDIKEDIDGVIDPTVAVGVFTLLEPPETDEVDLADLGLTQGLTGTLFLADARDVNDLASAPITGADLEVTGCGQTVMMDESASGTYTLSPGTALDTCTELITVTRTDSEKATVIPLTFPAAPTWTLPNTWRATDGDFVIPVSESDYDSALAVVMDASTADVTFSNEPSGVREYYEFLTGTGDIADITLTDAQMREDTVMAMLLTGLVKLRNVDMEEVNTALSIVDVGRTRLYAVDTTPPR